MTIRCDEKDKREAARVAEYYGFDSLLGHPRILEADGAHWTQSPLDLGNEEPNEESLAAIREAEQMMRDGSARELRKPPASLSTRCSHRERTESEVPRREHGRLASDLVFGRKLCLFRAYWNA